MPPVLKALLFGNFAIGCGVSGLAATLPEISSSLGVSVARAGGLITASSLMVAVGAPLCAAAAVIPRGQLWVNPDCGLKTRQWKEVEPALRNMVEAARKSRA